MQRKQAAVHVSLLGSPQFLAANQPIPITSRRAIALIAYLSLEEGRHRREKLATLLWSDYNDTRALANLRRTLWVLRQTPLGPFINTEHNGVQLTEDESLSVDALDMRKGVSTWREGRTNGSTPQRIEIITNSLALYKGDFLQDLKLDGSEEFEEWLTIQRNRLRDDALEGLDFLINYALNREDYEIAKEAAWNQLEIDSLRESAYKGLMIALSRTGEPAAALAQYDILNGLLTESGSEPSAELAALNEEIRSQMRTKLSSPSVHKTEPEGKFATAVSMPVFLFTDIENSTQLWDQHREVMLKALQLHNNILEELIGRHGGRIIELRGDGVYAVFEAGEPLEAVLNIQIAFSQTDWGAIKDLRIRAGLHGVLGDWEGYDYFREGDLYFGPVLNHAARVMDAAWGGQILVSEAVRELYSLPRMASWQDFGVHDLKGCDEPLHIYGLLHPELPAQSFPPIRTLTTQDQDDQLAADLDSAPALPASPYRGLYAFREQDAPFFFGREAFTELLMETVYRQPMVAVVGSSGSGKSSVVHAGLLAELRAQGNWLITSFRPGSRPFHSLATALIPLLDPGLSKTDHLVESNKLAKALIAGDIGLMDVVKDILGSQPPGTRLPLVGDQFEELYTLVPEVEERHHFMDLLTDAVFDQQYRESPVFSLVLTLRADFLGQALAHRPFADAIQESDVKLGPMTEGELSRAIIYPARALQVEFETGLVPRILEDVGEEPGNLPLLEFALAMLWEKQEDAFLTHQAYEAIDRVDGALARYADSVFDELDDQDQQTSRRIFIQVVRPGEGTEDTRRVARRSELEENGWRLVQRLADARLLVTGRDSDGQETVEVVHEALIRGWGRLRDWMNADREFRVWQERLRASIRQWESNDHDDGALLRGLPLASAENWLNVQQENLSQLEIDFILAGLAAKEGRDEAKRLRQERERQLERRAHRRLQVIAAVLVIASIFGIILTVAVFNQSRVAQSERDNARQQQNIAERRAAEVQSLAMIRAAEQALENDDPELALALAAEANKIEDPPIEVRQAMTRIGLTPGVAWGVQAHDSPISDVHLSPDGQFIVSASGRPPVDQEAGDDNSLALWDIATGQELQRYVGHEGIPVHIEFSPDGRQLLSSSLDGSFILWDLNTGEEIRRFQGQHPLATNVRYLDFIPEGKDGQAAIFWSVNQNEEIGDFFTPLLVADVDITVRDIDTGSTVHSFRPDDPEQFIKRSSLSEDRRILVTAQNSRQDVNILAPYSGTDTLILWDVMTGEIIRRLDVDAPGFWATDIIISPDNRVATIGFESADEGKYIIWDLESGDSVSREFDSFVGVHHYSPDGETFYIESSGLGIDEIDSHTGEIVRNLGESAEYITFGDGGNRMLSLGPMILWDQETGEEIVRFRLSDQLTSAILMPGGRSAVTGHESGMLRFWDIKSGQGVQSAAEAFLFDEHGSGVTGAVFSPDGKRVLSGGGKVEPGISVPGDNTALLWDAQSGEILQRLAGHEAPIWSIDYSPDRAVAATGSQDQSLILWDLESGEQIRRWDDLGETVMALDFAPDGASLLVGIGSPYGNPGVEGRLFVLDTQSGKELHTLELGDEDAMRHVWSVAFSTDGQSVLAGVHPQGLILWDLKTGQEIHRFQDIKGDNGVIEGLDFTSDGRSFVSASLDGSIILWDVESGQELRRYPTDPESVAHWVDISPDGELVIAAFGLPAIAGATTEALILWDLESGEELQRFEGHSGWVRGARFSPDGSLVVSSSGDGTVRLWNVASSSSDPLDWIRENRYIRDLTEEEAQRYRIDIHEEQAER